MVKTWNVALANYWKSRMWKIWHFNHGRKTLRRGSDGLYGSEFSGIRGIIVMCLQSTVGSDGTRWRNFTMAEKSCSLLERCEFEIFQFWGLHLFIGAGGEFWNCCVARMPGWLTCRSKSLEVLKSKHVDVKLSQRPLLMMIQKQQKMWAKYHLN